MRLLRSLALLLLALLTRSESNPYRVLEVDKSASSRDIRAAYRRMSLKYHPDKSSAPDAADRFAEVSNAYEVRSFLLPLPHVA